MTAEAAAYLGLFLLVLAGRLFAAAGAMLSPAEAGHALAAYALAQGAAPAEPVAGPGLVSLQALAFALFAANDTWARLPVLLLTSAYPFAFWLLRPLFGRSVSLAAAALLAVSPVWLTLGARAEPAQLGAVALLFALGCAVQAGRTGRGGWAVAGGVALGLALTTSGEAWGALALGAAVLAAAAWGGRLILPITRAQVGRFVVGLAAAVFLFGTALGANPLGLQGTLDLPVAWLLSFVRRQPGAAYSQVLLLTAYETLILVLALATLALRWPERRRERALYLWAAGALLLTVAGGHPLAGMALLLPALALLAGRALLGLGRRLRLLDGTLRLEAAVVTGVLAGYGYVALSGLANRGDTAFAMLALTAVGIGIALAGLVWARRGPWAAVALAAAAVVAVLALWGMGAAFQGAWARQQTAQELLYPQVTRTNAADLLRDVERLSWSRTGRPDELPLTAEQGVGPVVQWYLRDMRAVTWVERVPPTVDSEAILTAGVEPPVLDNPYVGQSYEVTGQWRPRFAGARALLSWLLYRTGEGAESSGVSLWVRDAEG